MKTYLTAFRYLKTALILLLLFAADARAQNEYQINFEGNGTLFGGLPHFVFPRDNLKFLISSNDNIVDKAKNKYLEQLNKAEIRIQAIRTDPVKRGILRDVYNISNDDLKELIREIVLVKADLSSTDTTLKYVPVLPLKPAGYIVNPGPGSRPGLPLQVNSPSVTLSCTTGLPDTRALKVNLYKIDLYQKLVFEWISKTKSKFGTNVDKLLLAKITANKAQYDAAAVRARAFINAAIAVGSSNDINEINRRITNTSRFIGQLEPLARELAGDLQLNGDREWVLSWLWYQDKELPLLNPFGIKTDADLLRGDTSANPYLRDQIEARNAFLQRVDYGKVTTRTIDAYIKEIADLHKKIADNTIAMQKAKDDTMANKKKIKALSSSTTLLNQALFYVSQKTVKDVLYVMRHHDARNEDALMDETEVPEYSEDDHVVILVHNVRANEQVNVSLSYKPITNPISISVQDLSDFATASSAGIIKLKNNNGGHSADDQAKDAARYKYTEELNKIQEDLNLFEAAGYLIKQSDPGFPEKEIVDSVYHTEKKLPLLRHKTEYVNYVIATTKKSVTSPLSDKTNLTPINITVYSSGAPSITSQSGSTSAKNSSVEKNAASTANASAPTTIASGDKSTASADTFTYRVNKLFRILPMAGIAATFPGFAGADSLGNIRKSSQLKVYVGAKIYLQKTDIRNMDFFTSRDFLGRPLLLSRIHFNVAIDPSGPLNNLYTGAGLDLWPGFSIDMGAVFNRYNYYSYTYGQGKVTAQYYRPGFFIGLSTDAALIAQLIKLF